MAATNMRDAVATEADGDAYKVREGLCEGLCRHKDCSLYVVDRGPLCTKHRATFEQFVAEKPAPPPPIVYAWRCDCGAAVAGTSRTAPNLLDCANCGKADGMGRVKRFDVDLNNVSWPAKLNDPVSLDLVPSSQLKPIDDDRTLAKRLRATEVALMECKDKLGDKDHAIAELHAKIGQLTMERDEALRKAGRR